MVKLEDVKYVDKKERKDETLHTALIKRLEETKESLNKVSFSRDIVLTIPVEILENEDTKDFIKKIGKISRTKSLGLPVELEEENIPTMDGEVVEVVNAVFKPTKDTDLEGIKAVLAGQ